eukprot:9634575-Alexandrium_andersonii.AAC.1
MAHISRTFVHQAQQQSPMPGVRARAPEAAAPAPMASAVRPPPAAPQVVPPVAWPHQPRRVLPPSAAELEAFAALHRAPAAAQSAP